MDLFELIRSRRVPGRGRGAAPEPLTHYEDVEPGSWYEADVADLLQRGVLDAAQRRFRPTDPAVRAEFAKILVKLYGIEHPAAPAVASFDDTNAAAWYHPFVEEAAARGWMRGYGDCYGTRPCMLRPGAPATRAEAAAMIVRYYGLEPTGRAPVFADVPEGAWYVGEAQIAADHCILQGDDGTGLLAPERLVNRAEMVTLFARAERGLLYGRDCGVSRVHAETAVPAVIWRFMFIPWNLFQLFRDYPQP